MNANEMLGIKYAVLILKGPRRRLEWSIAAADHFENLKV